MPASDEQVQDVILQLENITSTALAKAAAIDQAATDGEERAHPRQKGSWFSANVIQARTDKKVKGQVDQLNGLKAGRFIIFPDDLSPVELVSCDKIACRKCDHPFKVQAGNDGMTTSKASCATAVVTLLSCPSPQVCTAPLDASICTSSAMGARKASAKRCATSP
jgi:hypothetical protein